MFNNTKSQVKYGTSISEPFVASPTRSETRRCLKSIPV